MQALRFEECLHAERKQVNEIYILGDLLEMWIGDDDDSELAQFLYTTLRAANAHVPIKIMHGNRDFLLGDVFVERTGCELLADPYLVDDHILLSHGDQYCTDDAAYQALRSTMRAPEWQADILSKSLEERKAFGEMLREQSKAANANKATNIMDVNPSAVRQAMTAHSADILIHGHTHRPGMHLQGNSRRFVLGAWDRCGWVVRQTNDEFRLECFALAHHYGT